MFVSFSNYSSVTLMVPPNELSSVHRLTQYPITVAWVARPDWVLKAWRTKSSRPKVWAWRTPKLPEEYSAWLVLLDSSKQGLTRSLIQLSRREREFFPFNLLFQMTTRMSFFSISCYKTRTRISFFNFRLRDKNGNRDCTTSRENFPESHLLLAHVLVHCMKSIRAYNVKSSSTLFLDNILWNF